MVPRQDRAAERALIAGILGEPEADEPRRRYAAWLEDRGDPLGRLLARQLDPDTRAGVDDLIAAQRKAWRLPDRVGLRFVRGLVEDLALETEDLLRLRSIFVRGFALRSLALTGGPRAEEALLAAAKAFAEMPLASLRLETMDLGPGPVSALAGARFLPRIRELDLCGCRIDPPSFAKLLEAPLGALRRLAVRDVPLGDEGCRLLARSDRITALDTLELRGCSIGPAGASALCEARFQGVRRLGLDENPLGERGARALASAPALAGLERLGLASTEMGDEALRALCDSPHLPKTMILALDGRALGLRDAYLGDHAGHEYSWWEGDPPSWLAARFKIEVAGSP
jgi:hypothetical protein